MRDVTVGQVADAVLSIDFTYEEGAKGPFTPVARDIEMRRVTSRKSKYGLYLRGFAERADRATCVSSIATSRTSRTATSSSTCTASTPTGTTINGAPVR